MKALAIILARAGSKGLPRKNMLPVGPEVQCAGRRIRPPCAFWTLRHAIDSHAVGAIALSTDDDELKTLARDMDRAGELKPQRAAPPGPGPMGGEARASGCGSSTDPPNSRAIARRSTPRPGTPSTNLSTNSPNCATRARRSRSCTPTSPCARPT